MSIVDKCIDDASRLGLS